MQSGDFGADQRSAGMSYDIVPGQRIVYSYEMYQDGARISVSLAKIEFGKSGDGTAMTWTEQGAYLDGIDGADAPCCARKARPGCSMVLPRISQGTRRRAVKHSPAPSAATARHRSSNRRATERPGRAAAGSPPSA
jgi:hypothetical protein